MATRQRPVLRSAVALVSAVGVGASGLVLGVLLTFLVAGVLTLGTGIEMTPVRLLVLGLVTAQGITFPAVTFSYLKLRPVFGPKIRKLLSLPETANRLRIGVSVPSLRELGIAVLGYATAIGGLVVASVLISAVVSLLGVETGRNQAAEIGMQNPEVLLLLIPASFLLIGPGEELLFRGVVQGRLREVFGPVIGVFLASAVFAFIHFFALVGGSLAGNLIALGGLLIPALVLGAVYEYTGNIVVPALIHGAYNATLFSALYVAVKYSDQFSSVGVVGGF